MLEHLPKKSLVSQVSMEDLAFMAMRQIRPGLVLVQYIPSCHRQPYTNVPLPYLDMYYLTSNADYKSRVNFTE